jgi:hypothetical protein
MRSAILPVLWLLVMVVYGAGAGDLGAAWAFLFHFDFAAVNGAVVLMAIGQAFFSIGVSMGLMMVYGAYLPAGEPIGSHSLLIAAADTLVALLAGLAIFPLVFVHGLDPAEGPGLIFVTLPLRPGNGGENRDEPEQCRTRCNRIGKQSNGSVVRQAIGHDARADHCDDQECRAKGFSEQGASHVHQHA